MKKIIGTLLCIVLLCGSCQDEDPQPLTGRLVISRRPDTPTNVTIGVYDVSVLTAPYEAFLPAYTVLSGRFSQDKVEFPNLNPGNYVIGVVYSSITELQHQSVQVRTGETTNTSL